MSVIAVLLALVVVMCLNGLVIHLTWPIAEYLFALKPLTFGQSVGLGLLSSALFKSSGGGSGKN